MATFSTALLFGLLVRASASKSVMRSHKDQELMSMHLRSDGEVEKYEAGTGEASAVFLNADGSVDVQHHEAAMIPQNILNCDIDFAFGVENTSHCSDPANHKPINNKGMCSQAATNAGAPVHEATFEIKNTPKNDSSGMTLQDDSPKGCFSAPCTSGAGDCYFYNPIGDVPKNHQAGTPVCTRQRFINGTANTNGVGADCPTGYMVVNHTNRCLEVAECMANGAGEPFNRGVDQNNSKHEEFPEGCFIDAVDDKVYFNPQLPARGKPSNPKGTPVCKRAQLIKCSEGSCVTVSAFSANETNSPASKPTETILPSTR